MLMLWLSWDKWFALLIVVIKCQLSIGHWFIISLLKVLDETGSTPELVLCPLAPVHQGHYICRVNHGENCVFSQWAHIRFVHSAGTYLPSPLFVCVPLSRGAWCNVLVNLVISGCSSSLFAGSVSGLLITHQPQSQAASEGDILLLECNAEANPPAQYEWYHNMVPMKQHKTRLLKVSVFTAVDCLPAVLSKNLKKGEEGFEPLQQI